MLWQLLKRQLVVAGGVQHRSCRAVAAVLGAAVQVGLLLLLMNLLLLLLLVVNQVPGSRGGIGGGGSRRCGGTGRR